MVFFGIITPGISSMEIFKSALDVANLWPSVPTKVRLLVFSLEEILKYNPFKKYLVSSFEIANLVLLIKLNIVWALTVIFLELFVFQLDRILF